MQSKFNVTFIILLSLFLLSCEKEPDPISDKGSSLCSPKIMSYHFGVEALPVSRQVHLLDSLKMDGMILQIEMNSLGTLASYYETEVVKNNTFQIYDIFTSVFLDQPLESEKQIAAIEEIYKKIQNKRTILQVLFHGQKDNENATRIIARIADIAKKYGKDLVIYPHAGLAIETAEQALVYIKAVKKENVFLALHLCHELAAGNGSRIEEVVKNVAPYIKSASISGATESEQKDESLPPWFWGIKPLYMGNYNFDKYYSALYQYGYTGPIAIHTWGIYENFGLTPKDHLPRSRQVLLNLAANACK